MSKMFFNVAGLGLAAGCGVVSYMAFQLENGGVIGGIMAAAGLFMTYGTVSRMRAEAKGLN